MDNPKWTCQGQASKSTIRCRVHWMQRCIARACGQFGLEDTVACSDNEACTTGIPPPCPKQHRSQQARAAAVGSRWHRCGPCTLDGDPCRSMALCGLLGPLSRRACVSPSYRGRPETQSTGTLHRRCGRRLDGLRCWRSDGTSTLQAMCRSVLMLVPRVVDAVPSIRHLTLLVDSS